jgi:hypothetical protein
MTGDKVTKRYLALRICLRYRGFGLAILVRRLFSISFSPAAAVLIAGLIAFSGDADAAPSIASINPQPDSTVGALSSISIEFTEPVTGIDPTDLLINGDTAGAMTGSGSGPYVFTFAQPAPGTVSVEFAGDHSIAGLGTGAFEPPLPWAYTLADTQPPVIASLAPAGGSTVGALTQAEVVFSEVVTGMSAGDLLINDAPATSLSGSAAGPYVFTFPQPPIGAVNFAWADGHGIADTAGNAFAGGSWNVTRSATGAGDLIISEFVAVNSSAFLDEDGASEPWIEIHNPGPIAVNLGGWSLTNDPDKPGMWVFPNRVLSADGYLVVFASGKDRRPASGQLHTNFKLGIEADYLALMKPDMPRAGATVFDPYPPQRAGYSYGLASGQLRFFIPPTPGSANSTTALANVAAAPVPSVSRGFHDAPFQLELSTTTPGATVRYTTNGSEPTASIGTPYTGPIQVNSSTVLRAAAFADGYVPSETVTHTYLFLDQVLSQPNTPPGFPTTWGFSSAFPGGIVPADYEMDSDPLRVDPNNPGSAIDPVKLQRFKDGMREIASMSIVIPNSDMFASTGMYHSSNVQNKDFPSKKCSVEFFPTSGAPGFVTTCGLRMHGNASREPPKNPKHGLKLDFRPAFGPRSLEYRLFPDSALAKYDDIVIRPEFNVSWRHWSDTSSNSLGAFQRSRSTHIRDAWIKEAMRDMGGLASRNRPVHLFINGLYFGLYDLTDQPNNSFAQNTLGGQKGDYDVYDQGALKEGTSAVYNAMTSLPNANADSTYEQFKQYLDLPKFIDYMLLHFYVGHQDWGNTKNWAAIRQRAGGTFSTDGKFVYLPWDGENHSLNTNVNRVPDGGGSTNVPSNLHTKLDDNPQYRLDFADRVHKHLIALGGALTESANIARWQKWQAILDKPVVAESCRWGDYRRDVHPYSEGAYQLYTRENHWLAECARLVNSYFPVRRDIVLGQLRTAGLYPFLDAPEFRNAADNELTGSAHVTPGFQVKMTHPSPSGSQVIYYTTDGTDPRVTYTGDISNAAQPYAAPITISASTQLKARTLDSGTWSALNEAAFTTGSTAPIVRITELMYHPAVSEDFEFLELLNAGSLPVDVSGWSFTGFTYVFPPASSIPAGSRIVLANNDAPSAWHQTYPGVIPFGFYGGNLSNGGETITLSDANGDLVTSVTYSDRDPWPESPDGDGFSLEIIDPLGDPNDPANWKASNAVNGTPGTPNSPPLSPVITAHPQSKTVIEGANTSLIVSAAGTNLSYQWKFGNTNIGGNSDTLTLNSVTPANEGTYRCVVSNPNGSATSDPATLTVAQTFSQWASDAGLTGGNAAPDADPDDDGIVNIIEFLHHLDPSIPASASDRANLPHLETESIAGQPVFLTLTYRLNPRAAVGAFTFERSLTLAAGAWSTVTPTVTETLAPDPVTGDPRVRVKFSIGPDQAESYIRLDLAP